MSEISVPADGRLRILSYATTDGSTRLGLAIAGGYVVDIEDAARAKHVELPFTNSMQSLIESGEVGLIILKSLAGHTERKPINDVKILPPLPRITRNIYCVGWNYLEHFEEGKSFRDPNQKLPEHPVFFTKGVNALNSPFGDVPFNPAVSSQIDWEVELTIVIGKGGRNIPETDARAHIFGYTVMNDISARDLQKAKHGGQWFKGKSLDGHAPLGPWIVPAAEIDDTDINLKVRVNGVEKQNGSSQQMYFKVPRIIAELSAGLTLDPGDLIATGTPPGVGQARVPPEFLKPGDVMETEIVEIGTLRNVIRAE